MAGGFRDNFAFVLPGFAAFFFPGDVFFVLLVFDFRGFSSKLQSVSSLDSRKESASQKRTPSTQVRVARSKLYVSKEWQRVFRKRMSNTAKKSTTCSRSAFVCAGNLSTTEKRFLFRTKTLMVMKPWPR